jgi:hypothetical protein
MDVIVEICLSDTDRQLLVLESVLWPRYPLFPSGASGEESRMIWIIIAAKAAICAA